MSKSKEIMEHTKYLAFCRCVMHLTFSTVLNISFSDENKKDSSD